MKEKSKADDYSVHNLWKIPKNADEDMVGLPESEEDTTPPMKAAKTKSSRNSSV